MVGAFPLGSGSGLLAASPARWDEWVSVGGGVRWLVITNITAIFAPLSSPVAGCRLPPCPQPKLALSALRTSGNKCSELRARSSGVSLLHVLRGAFGLALARGRAASGCGRSAKPGLDSRGVGGMCVVGRREQAARTRTNFFFFLSLSFYKLPTFQVYHPLLTVPPLGLALSSSLFG
jgi:hypothetical protein